MEREGRDPGRECVCLRSLPALALRAADRLGRQNAFAPDVNGFNERCTRATSKPTPCPPK